MSQENLDISSKPPHCTFLSWHGRKSTQTQNVLWAYLRWRGQQVYCGEASKPWSLMHGVLNCVDKIKLCGNLLKYSKGLFFCWKALAQDLCPGHVWLSMNPTSCNPYCLKCGLLSGKHACHRLNVSSQFPCSGCHFTSLKKGWLLQTARLTVQTAITVLNTHMKKNVGLKGIVYIHTNMSNELIWGSFKLHF